PCLLHSALVLRHLSSLLIWNSTSLGQRDVGSYVDGVFVQHKGMVLNSPPRDLNHSSEELSAIQASRVQSSHIVPNRFFDFLCGQHSPSQMTCTMAEGYSQRHLVGDCRCTLSDISAGLVNLYDFEARARERLTEMAYADRAS